MRPAAFLLALALGIVALGRDFWGVGELFLLGGARDEGLGGILAVPLSFPEASRLNPAGLGFAGGISLGSSYSRRFDALNSYSLEAAGRYWGISIVSLDAGPLDGGPPYTAHGVVLAVGLPVGDLLGVGVGWKGFFQAAPREAFGWAVDPGLVLKAEGFSLGIVWENAAAGPVDYGDHREPWPPGARGGVALALDLGEVRLTLVGNLRYSAASPLEYALGLEVGDSDWAFRLGYGSSGFRLGASLGFLGYRAHWALVIHPHLPPTVSAGASWGPGR